MMRKKTIVIFLLLPLYAVAQQEEDSMQLSFLRTVTVNGSRDRVDSHLKYQRYDGQARTERLLENIPGVSLIGRGNFAQEPVLRGMSDGQVNITLNGMRIFGACTDRMDPATSYIEPNNLQSVEVNYGPSFGIGGATIGGGMNFNLRQAALDAGKPCSVSVGSGFETNAQVRQFLGSWQYSGKRFALLLDGIYRKAENYSPGGNKQDNIDHYGNWASAKGFSVNDKGQIHFSQYQKWNAHANAVYQLALHHWLKADYLQDDGKHIGYPALTMDVAFARGQIGSLSHEYRNVDKAISHWETKVYYNYVNHAMDDTKRPPEQVSMHMDMPGNTKTGGAYSQIRWNVSPHQSVQAKAETFVNRWHAEMTMYPNGGVPMFMLTIPDAQRSVTGMDITDRIHVGSQWHIAPGIRTEYNRSSLFTELGRQTVTSIYTANANRNEWLYNAYVQATYQPLSPWQLDVKLARAMRAPSLKEAYAFYLFDRVDGYDYLGNPAIRRESSFNGEISLRYHRSTFKGEFQLFGYHFRNYIAGFVQSSYSPMTAGANGVKQYGNIPSSDIAGGEILLSWQPWNQLYFSSNNTYQQGKDGNGNALPMMPPFRSVNTLRIAVPQDWHFFVENVSTLAQNKTSPFYGETRTPGFVLFNAGLDKMLSFGQQQIIVSITGNNLFNQYYYEHLDVIKLPRPGRNLIFHLTYKL